MSANNNSFGLLRLGIYVVAIAFLVKLFSLQIIDSQYKLQAKNNVVKKITVYPSRGTILDRNGKVIVSNEAVYDLNIQFNLLKDHPFDTTLFCELLNTTPEFVAKRLEEIKRYNPNKPSPLLKLVSQSTFASIQEFLYNFPALSYTTRTVRTYPYKGAAHVLGYLGEVNKDQIDQSMGYYEMGEYIGITGLESKYEEYLRGKKGFTYQITDVRGRVQGVYNDGADDVQPVSGFDLVTALDIDLQTYGELLMQNKIGSIVAIEPQTGGVLAYISSPGYDPNLMAGRYRGHNYQVLSKDKNKPLINRPISATYPPGSIFKIPADLVVFNNGIHGPDWSYSCLGAYYGKGIRVGCHGSHYLPNVVHALKISCNAYSCTVFKDMLTSPTFASIEEGYVKWKDGIKAFGFGDVLGIDVAGEKKGNIPSEDYFNQLYGKGRWHANTIISLAIGQGEVLSTPLQMANMMAAVANDGSYYRPKILKYFIKDKKLYQPIVKEVDVGISKEFYPPIKEALAEVVRSGTAARSKSTDFDFAAKTGTSQNPHGKDHSIFVAYAPLENPVIAIAVVIDNAGFGSTYAAPIASLMIEKYLNDTISSKRLYMEERMLNANLIWEKQDSTVKTTTIQQ